MSTKFYESFLEHQLRNITQIFQIPNLNPDKLICHLNLSKKAFKKENGHSIHSMIVISEIQKNIHNRNIIGLAQLEKQSSGELAKILRKIIDQMSYKDKTDISGKQSFYHVMEKFFSKFEDVRAFEDEFISLLNKFNQQQKFEKNEPSKQALQKSRGIFGPNRMRIYKLVKQKSDKNQFLSQIEDLPCQYLNIIYEKDKQFFTAGLISELGIAEIYNLAEQFNLEKIVDQPEIINKPDIINKQEMVSQPEIENQKEIFNQPDIITTNQRESKKDEIQSKPEEVKQEIQNNNVSSLIQNPESFQQKDSENQSKYSDSRNTSRNVSPVVHQKVDQPKNNRRPPPAFDGFPNESSSQITISKNSPNFSQPKNTRDQVIESNNDVSKQIIKDNYSNDNNVSNTQANNTGIGQKRAKRNEFKFDFS